MLNEPKYPRALARSFVGALAMAASPVFAS